MGKIFELLILFGIPVIGFTYGGWIGLIIGIGIAAGIPPVIRN